MKVRDAVAPTLAASDGTADVICGTGGSGNDDLNAVDGTPNDTVAGGSNVDLCTVDA